MTRIVRYTFDELSVPLLYRILQRREEIFVVEQDCAYLDIDGHDPVGWHVVGFDRADDVVAYARILPPGTTQPEYPSIGRVIVAESVRRKGVGGELMREALRGTDELFPGTTVKISAQSYLIDFYEALGFHVVGEPYLEDGIWHRAMLRPARALPES